MSDLDFGALTPLHRRAIEAIHRSGGIAVDDLGTTLGLTRSEADGVVAALLEAHWIRAQSPPKGPTTVRLHFAGATAFEKATRPPRR